MWRKVLVCLSILLLSAPVFAQDEDLQAKLDYRLHKMQATLQLTDDQTQAIRPIVKDYLSKRTAILQEMSGQGIVDHVAVKSTLKDLKEKEYQQLSTVLSPEQVKKWVNKENLMAALNPDGGESTLDDGPSLSPEGANFKF